MIYKNLTFTATRKDISEFRKISMGKDLSKSTLEATKEFTSALLISVCQGASEAASDFVPSLYSSVYGLGETL
jgi:hypothetical protein